MPPALREVKLGGQWWPRQRSAAAQAGWHGVLVTNAPQAFPSLFLPAPWQRSVLRSPEGSNGLEWATGIRVSHHRGRSWIQLGQESSWSERGLWRETSTGGRTFPAVLGLALTLASLAGQPCSLGRGSRSGSGCSWSLTTIRHEAP